VGRKKLIHLRDEDIEIEETIPGPIVHIFPPNDPYDAVEEIMASLYCYEEVKQAFELFEKTIKEKESAPEMIMLTIELKRILDISKSKSLKFMEKV
jgi:hypothetical protein